MSNDFDKYLAIANHDIQVAENMEELKSYVASILYDNDKKVELLQQKENIMNEVKEDLYQVVKWCTENKHNENTIKRYLVVDYGTIVGKINKIRTKLDKGE